MSAAMGDLLRTIARLSLLARWPVGLLARLNKLNQPTGSTGPEAAREHQLLDERLAHLASLPRWNPFPMLVLDAAGVQVTYLNQAARSAFPDLETRGIHHPVLQDVGAITGVLREQGTPSLKREVTVGERIFEQWVVITPDPDLTYCYLADITELKRFQRQWQDQVQALEHRNADLAHREHVMQSLFEDLETSHALLADQSRLLSATNKRLKQLSEMKDEFVAKVSHEFRTPMTSIKEGLNLLLDGVLGRINAEQRDFITTMDADVDRLTDLVSNMLDLSKIGVGRMRLVRGRLDVAELIAALLRSCRLLLAHRQVQVECPQPSWVFGDRNRLLQVLTNLLSNAIKMTDPAQGRIVFRVSQSEGVVPPPAFGPEGRPNRNSQGELAVGEQAGGGMVTIAVEDNGPGISSQDLPKLFQKFSQLDSTRTGTVRGTGLGLAVCKELIELHGGHVEAASVVGQGSVFTVRVPLYRDEFALKHSFLEVADQMPFHAGQTVGLVAIQSHGNDVGGGEVPRREALETLADHVRRRMHQGDVVLALESSWVVALLLAHPADLPKVVERLRQALPDGPSCGFGMAVYPQHGAQVEELFAYATSHLNQPLVMAEAVSDSPPARSP